MPLSLPSENAKLRSPGPSARDAGSERVLRGARLRLAVVAALGSKVMSVGVQALALPVAVRALGIQEFAVYAIISALAGWLTLASAGVGPSLTVRLAGCVGDHHRESQLFHSGMLPVVLASTALGAAFLAASWLLPLPILFGRQVITHENEVRLGLSALAGMMVVQSIASVVESAQSGFQETHLQNLRGLIGNFLTGLAVIGVAMWRPSVIGLLLAVQGPAVLSRVVNALMFLARRPYLLAQQQWSWRASWDLVRDGAAFALAGGIGAFLTIQAPVVIVGREASPAEASSFAASMSLFVMAAGMVSMLVTPMWPAVADAVARNDRDWLKSSYRRVLTIGMVYATGAAGVVGAAGNIILRYWMGPAVGMPRPLALAWGLAFVCHVWEHLHFMLLTGGGRIVTSSMIFLLRSAGTVLLTLAFVGSVGTPAPFLAYAFMVTSTSAWLLRAMYRTMVVGPTGIQ